MENLNNLITADDLYRVKEIYGCEISPNNKKIIYSLTKINKRNEDKYSNLWMTSSNKESQKQITFGNYFDTHPRWSPDGREIAFISNRENKKEQQIYLITKTNKIKKITNLKGEIKSFEWSPNGEKIVAQYRKTDTSVNGIKNNNKSLGIAYRHITRITYKEDGYGFLPKERWHIITIDLAKDKTQEITSGNIFDEIQPHWTPDGKEILFLSNRSKDPDFNPDSVDIYTISENGDKLRKINTHLGKKETMNISPDGEWVAFVGREHRADWGQNDRLWIVPFEGNEAAIDLTKHEDISILSSTTSDISNTEIQTPIWSKDSKSIYFQVAHHGISILKSVSIITSEIKNIVNIKGVVGDYSIDLKETKIAYILSDNKNTGQINILDIKNQTNNKLFQSNKWINQANLGEIEEVWVNDSDQSPLQGWIMKPPNFKTNKKYPSILFIHGGPLTQYGNIFMHQFRFFSSNGYIVSYCNPRGGRGYGEQNTKSIWNNNGTEDYHDVMRWTTYLKSLKYINNNSMGVTGGSYGGFMVNWIIGHTNTFASAVSEVSIINRTSSYGTSDWNWLREEAFGDEPPWENIENYLRQSPITSISNATTPTLVIHNENDMRCPIEQGEQLFVALKRIGVDTEMIRFPDEFHSLKRTDRNIIRLNQMLIWFNKYLK